tara:strand:+ start:1303 stop:2583 length:1281 start_codon:yes stop_codon:yes gene_type:complete
MNKKGKIAIIGLGYVGLPLAVAFSKKFRVIGYDINDIRVKELLDGHDNTLEVSNEILTKMIQNFKGGKSGFFPTTNENKLSDCDIYIVTVPTPTDKNKRPVLTPLREASKLVGKYLSKDNVVIYESTVYPGVTEEFCVPIIEKISNLSLNEDFYVGYSPERINPGDKERTIEKILKITSGSDEKSSDFINWLYSEIIIAGTYLAPSIKVAEAAKVIENSQRDINIAFINELSKIFNLLDIDTNEVLDAAATKWNFLRFKPGLVGGHCIGVDPYYIAQKAQEVGYHPEIILAGRKLNDSMGSYISREFAKILIDNNLKLSGFKVVVLGITFKENCPDTRNTKVIDLINGLNDFGIDVSVYDPWIDDTNDLKNKIKFLNHLDLNDYDGIIHAVEHDEFKKIDFKKAKAMNKIIYDIKGTISKNIAYRL